MTKQELARRIVRDMGYEYQTARNIIDGIAFEGWLHDPNQVPGRTITESELSRKLATVPPYADKAVWLRAVLNALGITVVPDPEPTNAEKLEEDLRSALRESGISLGYTNIDHVVEYLDSSGWSKAPGGDNAEKARSDAEWALNIDRQGGA